jgi:hypothetical protein
MRGDRIHDLFRRDRAADMHIRRGNAVCRQIDKRIAQNADADLDTEEIDRAWVERECHAWPAGVTRRPRVFCFRLHLAHQPAQSKPVDEARHRGRCHFEMAGDIGPARRPAQPQETKDLPLVDFLGKCLVCHVEIHCLSFCDPHPMSGTIAFITFIKKCHFVLGEIHGSRSATHGKNA